jgi:hypothetical protein
MGRDLRREAPDALGLRGARRDELPPRLPILPRKHHDPMIMLGNAMPPLVAADVLTALGKAT